MSEQVIGGETPVLHPDELTAAIELAILGTPGVARIEPTLIDAVRRIRHTLLGTDGASQGGVRLARHAESVDVAVDIAVVGQALEVATAVRERVGGIVRDGGLSIGTVEVSVLAVLTEAEELDPHRLRSGWSRRAGGDSRAAT